MKTQAMEEIFQEINTERDLAEARRQAKELSKKLGLGPLAITKFITAVSELGRNMLNHAGSGTVVFSESIGPKGKGKIQATFKDQGPGIAEIESALKDGFSTGGSLGLGLPGAKRLCAEFEVLECRNGTEIRIAQW